MSQGEPQNPEDKHAICMGKENKKIGNLTFGNSSNFAKTIFFFLTADQLGFFKVIITEKFVDLGDGNGTPVPCKLIFSGVKKCIDIFQKQIL